MADASANLTRQDIVAVVKLLGKSPDSDNFSVDIPSTTIDGTHEEPVSLYRAFLQIHEYRELDGECFDPADHPELFEYAFFPLEGEDDYSPIEVYDPEADTKAAREIVSYLTKRFDL